MFTWLVYISVRKKTEDYKKPSLKEFKEEKDYFRKELEVC